MRKDINRMFVVVSLLEKFNKGAQNSLELGEVYDLGPKVPSEFSPPQPLNQ